jgi:hypothetical protein
VNSGENQEREAAEFVGFALLRIFILWFSAQKSRVKPPTHLTLCQTTTSRWRISYAQSGILK